MRNCNTNWMCIKVWTCLNHLIPKFKNVWGAKLTVTPRLSPRRIVESLLTIAALYTPAYANVEGYYRRGRRCQHGTASCFAVWVTRRQGRHAEWKLSHCYRKPEAEVAVPSLWWQENNSNFACSIMTPKCVIRGLRANNIRTHKCVNRC